MLGELQSSHNFSPRAEKTGLIPSRVNAIHSEITQEITQKVIKYSPTFFFIKEQTLGNKHNKLSHLENSLPSSPFPRATKLIF